MGCPFDDLITYQLPKMRLSIHHLLHGLLVTLLPLTFPATLVRANKMHVPLPYICFEQSYQTNTTYETNLHALMSELTSEVTVSNGFKRTTLGKKAEDSVTGYALCRGDISQSACRECLNFSTAQLLHEVCPGRVGAMAWYDNCMLKYSPSLPPVPLGPYFPYDLQGPLIDVSNSGAYFEARYKLLSLLANKASMGNLTRKFSVGNINFTVSDKIYALMQCVPDMNVEDCALCLNFAASALHPVQKWRTRYLDCDLRIAPTQLYDTSFIESESYSLPPVMRNDVIYEGNTHRYVVAIIILTVCCLVLLATICIFLCLMWPKKKIQSTNDRTSASGLQTIRIEDVGAYQGRDQRGVGESNARPIMEIPMLAGQNQRTRSDSNYTQDETSHTWILKTPVEHPNPR